MAPTLTEGFAHEGSHDQIEGVWQKCAKDQQPQVYPGIPEDPSKQKDRSGQLPEDHRFGSKPIEGGVGEGVGDDILFPGNVLELVGDLLEQPTRL